MLPCGAGPVLDESLVHAGAVDGFAHGPGVAGGQGDHAIEDVVVGGAAGVGARHPLPRGAVPVLDERLVGGPVDALLERRAAQGRFSLPACRRTRRCAAPRGGCPSTADSKKQRQGDPAPCHFQFIAHRGTCGKARVVPHNRRPGSEFMEWVIRRCVCCCRCMTRAGGKERDEGVPNARFGRVCHAARSVGHRSAAEHGLPGGIAMIERYVLGLEEIDKTQVALVGGKGAHLGELSRIEGIRVPAGFCVTTDAFRRIITTAPWIDDQLDRLSRLDPDDRQAIRTLSAEIRRTLEGIAIPDDLAAAITRSVTRLGGKAAYAVRSSATAEDLPTASFAGQQDTYLNVVGLAAILQHVSRCWASLFTERAVTYRVRNGF